MSLLEPGDYYILDASDDNYVSLANSNNQENLTLQVKKPDRTVPDTIGREWRILPKMPGSDEYWIRNIKYNDTYATWAPFPRPTEVQGVWQRQNDLTRPQMLWNIKRDPILGLYRIYPAIDDPNFTACWNIFSSMQGNFVDISTPIPGSNDKHSLWRIVEAELPQAYLFEVSLPAYGRSPLNKLEIVFVQEIPSSKPITSYMDTICRPLISQNKIKYDDLRVCLIELEYKAETSQTSLRYADSFPFDKVGGWRGVDFPWETMNEPPVDGVLKAMKRKRNWTPGSLTIVIFNISSMGFRNSLLDNIGGENGCILMLVGNQHTTGTPAFKGLARLSSGTVLSVPPSNIGEFMVEARKTADMVALARTFKDAQQWYPKAGRMLDIGMTADELRDFESNPRAPTQAESNNPPPPPPPGGSSNRPGKRREKPPRQEEEDIVIVTFRNNSNYSIELTWVGAGTQKKDSKDPKNQFSIPAKQLRVVPMPVGVRHKFFMINGQRLIKAFTRLFQDDATVDLAALYAE